MFSSIKYMKSTEDSLIQAIESLKECIDWFMENNPVDNWRTEWHVSAHPDWWNDRVIGNMTDLKKSLHEGIKQFMDGDNNRIVGTTNSIMNLSRNMDVMDDKFLDYLPEDLKDKYVNNMARAQDMSSNIWWTLGEYWDPGEIIDQEITGPINEEELLKYLEPGENI